MADHDLPRRPAPRSDRRALLLDGPINGESFRSYVERVLLPSLQPSDILDNLCTHKGKAVRQLIRSAGAKLIFLPNIHRT
jgi:transposase